MYIIWTLLRTAAHQPIEQPLISSIVGTFCCWLLQSGFWNPWNLCLWNTESRKFFLWNSESWASETGIQLKESGIQDCLGLPYKGQFNRKTYIIMSVGGKHAYHLTTLNSPHSEEKDKYKKGVTSVTKDQETGKICLLYRGFIVSRFFWNYKFYYYWGKVNCSLNWGLHYIEVCYVEVSLYNYCTNLRSLYSLVFNFLFTFSVSMPGASRQSWSPSKRGVTWDITGCK